VAPREDRPRLHPDDSVVEVETGFLPGLHHQVLADRRVPLVDRRLGLQVRLCDVEEPPKELDRGLRVVIVVPVLLRSALVALGGRALAAVVVHEIGRVGRQELAVESPVSSRTYGRVSRAGVIPLSWSLDYVGPMARSVDDLALMLQVIAGPDPRDSTASRVPVPDFSSSTLRQPREDAYRTAQAILLRGCDDEVLQVLEQVSSGFRDLGHDTVEIKLPNANLGPAAWAMAYSEAFAYHRKTSSNAQATYTGAFLWKITAAGMLSAEGRIVAQRIQQAATDDFVSVPAEVDAIIVPVVRRAPAKLGASPTQRGDDTRSTTRPISLTGLPSLVLPCGFSRAGMPLAFQLVGRSWDEETLFMIGRSWETVHDWRKSRPDAPSIAKSRPALRGMRPAGHAASPSRGTPKTCSEECAHVAWLRRRRPDPAPPA
jgi:hypothetical protein